MTIHTHAVDESSANWIAHALRRGAMIYGAGAVLTVLSQFVLARLMGAAEYGIYYLAMTWFIVLSLLVRFGMDNVFLRELPGFISSANWKEARSLVHLGTSFVSTLAALMAALVALVVWLFSDHIDISTRITLLLGLPCLFLLGLMYLRQAVLRSFKHIVRSLFPEAIVAPSVLILLVLLLPLLGLAPSAGLVMAATVFAFAIAAGLGFFWQTRALPLAWSSVVPAVQPRRWLPLAISMLVINGMHLLLNNLDTLVLGLYRSSEEIGIYGISARLAFIVAFPLTMANAVFAPLIAEHFSKHHLHAIQHVLAKGMRFVSIAALFLAGLMWVFGDYALSIFGVEFIAGHKVLMILVAAQLVNAASGPVALLLAQCGHERLVAKIMVITVILAAILDFNLIPKWGTSGAAVATSLSIVFWNLCMLVLTKRHLGIDASGWYRGGKERSS
jgi:O-antigen/teichoic acid export membrane protein